MNTDKSISKQSWSKESPDIAWDYIVIGSGIGGMATAALLSKAGKKVLVLEQHYVPGGYTHVFRRKGYEWDVGVHVVSEVTDDLIQGCILSALTDGELKWEPFGATYDSYYFPGNYNVEIPSNPKEYLAMLIELFPDEEEAIHKYFQILEDVADGMKAHFASKIFSPFMGKILTSMLSKKASPYMDITTDEMMKKLFKDPKLRAILTAQWGYYGMTPANSSFIFHAIVVKHFAYGGYYPIGGSKEIAKTLLKTVANAGGWTRIKASVEEIIIEKGRAIGVRLHGGEEIKARRVISGVGLSATLQHLLPPSYQKEEWGKSIKNIRPSATAVVLYIGFKGDISQAGATTASKWFYDSFDMNKEEKWDLSDPENIDSPNEIFCSFPSLKDPRHDPGPLQMNTGEVLAFASWDDFDSWSGTKWQKRGDEYNAFKQRIEEVLLAKFLEKMPELKSMVDYVELSTPLSNEYFCRPLAGSIYGLEPSIARLKNKYLRPKSPIKNLYFTGNEIIAGGVMSSVIGGIFAGLAAEPFAVINYLRKII